MYEVFTGHSVVSICLSISSNKPNDKYLAFNISRIVDSGGDAGVIYVQKIIARPRWGFTGVFFAPKIKIPELSGISER
jgi:hypothetical protein